METVQFVLGRSFLFRESSYPRNAKISMEFCTSQALNNINPLFFDNELRQKFILRRERAICKKCETFELGLKLKAGIKLDS